jgi:hypothetical protein
VTRPFRTGHFCRPCQAIPDASQSLGGCRKLCWRPNFQPVDQSLALRCDLLFGAADLRRDLFVGLALGQAPQELLFARAEDEFALRTGCLVATELVATCSHLPGSTLPNRRQRAQFGDGAMARCRPLSVACPRRDDDAVTVRAVARAGSGFDACRAVHLNEKKPSRGLYGDGFSLKQHTVHQKVGTDGAWTRFDVGRHGDVVEVEVMRASATVEGWRM